MNDSDKSSSVDSSAETVDRIVLRRVENNLLQGWISALNVRFEGMIRVTKSDLANFLIRQHAETLSEAEINLIEAELFDEVRWFNWAIAKVRQAKKQGLSLSLTDLMAKRQSIQVRKDSGAKHAKQRRRKQPSLEPDPVDEEKADYSSLEEG